MNSATVDMRQALEKPEFMESLREILSQADDAIAEKAPECLGCGKCCDFKKMDHRLYVSTGELALLSTAQPSKPAELLQCPYQVESKCTARNNRPLGCRAYFCKSNLPDDFYEHFHNKIQKLHQTFQVPYRYMELTQALLNTD